MRIITDRQRLRPRILFQYILFIVYRKDMLHLGTGLCSIPVDVLNNTTLDDRGATVGRGQDCVVSINQHNNTHSKLYRLISKQHALLRLSDDGLYVKDFESRNGTFVNQTKLTDNSWVKLRENDIVSLGWCVGLS